MTWERGEYGVDERAVEVRGDGKVRVYLCTRVDESWVDLTAAEAREFAAAMNAAADEVEA